jgi:hypothetical protein
MTIHSKSSRANARATQLVSLIERNKSQFPWKHTERKQYSDTIQTNYCIEANFLPG